VIPYGIVVKNFERPNEAGVRAIREQYGPRVVLAVGRLVYYKGFEFLIRAMSKVDATLLLIGTGPLHEALSSEIRNRGLESRVHLLGDVDSQTLLHYYHAADLLVLPSLARSEAFGIVQAEAMACGKPVINTSLDTGVPFVSQNGVTGITVPPQDSEALASSIQFLFENEAIRKKFGEAARRRVQERFTVEAMTEKLLGLYGQLNPRFATLSRRPVAISDPVQEVQ
jgi:rhamnosyl/mannosyltransferase